MKTTLSLVALLLVGCTVAIAADRKETLDDFLSNPARVKDIKTFCLIFASQTDPEVGARNTAEIRRSFWANRPEAKLTDQQRQAELEGLDNDWRLVSYIIRARNMSTVYFCGIDNILPVKKAQYWYFAGFTANGPVLIRLAVQFNPGASTLHGVKVWTDWEEIKTISRSIEIPAGDKVFSFTYEKDKNPPATAPATTAPPTTAPAAAEH